VKPEVECEFRPATPTVTVGDGLAMYKDGRRHCVQTTAARSHNWIGLCSVLCPRQHNIGYMGDGFFQVKRAHQQYQSTEGNATKDKSNNENNKIHICTDNNRDKKGYTQNKFNNSPSPD